MVLEAKPRLEPFTCLSRGWEGPAALPLWTTPDKIIYSKINADSQEAYNIATLLETGKG